MFCILVTMYVRLARREEQEAQATIGEIDSRSFAKTHAFFPHLRRNAVHAYIQTRKGDLMNETVRHKLANYLKLLHRHRGEQANAYDEVASVYDSYKRML